MNVKSKNIENHSQLQFSISDLVNFCLGQLGDPQRTKIETAIIFDDVVLNAIRTIRRIQREKGDDYNTIMAELKKTTPILLNSI